MKVGVILSILIVFNTVFAQSDYHPPLDIPLVLASNFGELRPNHFHMGLDFKTNGVTGLKLYSISDGFIKRVVVSPYGYGKVVYIQHPDGKTSVYAHCSEFTGKLKDFVTNKIIELRNNQIDLELKSTDLPIKKGEVFALSGNTGSSTAPHLHFELRETATDAGLNPLLHGFKLEDHQSPELFGVKVYSLTKEGYRYPNMSKERTVKGSNGAYELNDTISIPANFCSRTGGIGFAFDMIDRLDGASNKCGVLGYELYIGENIIFNSKIEKVPFESTRYVNCHKDFEEYANHSKNYHKAFRTIENSLPIYGNGLGIIKSKPGEILDLKLKAFDAAGNESILTFTVRIEAGEINEFDDIITNPSYLNPSFGASFKRGNVELSFPKYAVYEPIRMNVENFSKTIGIRDIPVHKGYSLKISNITNGKDQNYYLLFRTAKGRTRVVSSEIVGTSINAEDVKYFGDFYVAQDSIAPTIKPERTSITNSRKLTWTISDSQSGIKSYALTIGNTWIPVDYEYKDKTLTAYLPETLNSEFTLKLVLTDGCGNEAIWQKEY